MINTPTNARELHDLLVQIPDLCGTFTIENENCLRWDLWEDYCLSVGVNRTEACVALEKASRFRWQITHWHTDNDDILEELMSIGKKETCWSSVRAGSGSPSSTWGRRKSAQREP